MPNVLFFTDDAPEITALVLCQAPPTFEVNVQSSRLPEAEQERLVAEADFLILNSRMPAEQALRAAQRLKLIQLMSAGYNHINLDLCRELGLPVANNGGANAIDVAEHTLALILGVYRRLFATDAAARNNRWRPEDFSLSAHTIHGRTVGIIGAGKIGQRVAHLLHAFGARVLYYDAWPLPAVEEATLGITRATLPDLLRQADIVTLHVNLSPESYHLIGQQELALMKPTALLVNTCRGAVVDEAALLAALTERRIMGAALDVLEEEPPAPDNPILKLDNVLLSPHMAGNSHDTWLRRGQFAFDNIQRVWAGQPPQAVVSRA